MDKPVISIILATYNRSNILGYSIQSVLWQTYDNFELIVIGDCCTDDTECVVSNFNDPRISFINLEDNFGEQSGPNNVGLRRAKGEYIAFLNHDDLWFPDHLMYSLKMLKSSSADLVLASGFIDYPDDPDDCALTGVLSKKYGYHPSRTFVPASNWVFKSQLIDEIGFWNAAKNLYLAPSHDWLKRVFEAGKVIVPTKHFTVIALPSSSRANSYLNRQSADSEYYFKELRENPFFRENLLEKHLYPCYEKWIYDENIYYKRYFKQTIRRLLIFFGINTIELNFKMVHGKGGLVAKYRKTRGLISK